MYMLAATIYIGCVTAMTAIAIVNPVHDINIGAILFVPMLAWAAIDERKQS